MQIENTFIINHIQIIIEKSTVFIKLEKKSDIISMFIIIKFFSLKKELNSIYIINQDEKGTVIYTKENQFEIQDLNLNAFLKYYAKRSLKKDKTSDFDENSDTKIING